MMKRQPCTRSRLLLAMLALSLLIAACGQGQSEPETAPPTTVSAADAEAEAVAVAAFASSPGLVSSECGADASIPEREPITDLTVAIVAPSAERDHAFTQSMTDSLTRLGIDYQITEGAFMLDVAAEALRDYADDVDVVIAHGTQYGDLLTEIAPEFPSTSFLWGTSTSTLDLPNVYAYFAEAQEGAYVNGWIAAEIARGYPIAVVGPFEAGDAVDYVNGFRAGAQANGADGVDVTYTGSFSDVDLAAQAAEDHLAEGVTVLTGTSQSAIGAVDVAAANDVPWFGTQSNHEAWSTETVVASQVYHWEVVLDDMFEMIESGELGGSAMGLTLDNGGLVIEVNGCYGLDSTILVGAAEVIESIIAGDIEPPT